MLPPDHEEYAEPSVAAHMAALAAWRDAMPHTSSANLAAVRADGAAPAWPYFDLKSLRL